MQTICKQSVVVSYSVTKLEPDLKQKFGWFSSFSARFSGSPWKWLGSNNLETVHFLFLLRAAVSKYSMGFTLRMCFWLYCTASSRFESRATLQINKLQGDRSRYYRAKWIWSLGFCSRSSQVCWFLPSLKTIFEQNVRKTTGTSAWANGHK